MSDHTKLYLVCENKCLVEYPADEIAKIGYQVGDVLTTVRTNLGEDWLLCNGELIRESDYPELYDMLKSFGLANKQTLFKMNETTLTARDIIYANGYWVVCGPSGTIAYTTDLTGDWIIKQVWTSVNDTYASINCITYADGYWVVGGEYCSSSSSRSGTIAYTTDLTGDWIIKQVFGTASSQSYRNVINCITYADGYWVVGGKYSTSSSASKACIAYTTNLTGNWTVNKEIWTNSNFCAVNCITYADGYWVVGGEYSSGKYACIAYTTDLTGDLTVNNLWYNTSETYTSNINCITYADGYWVVGGKYYDDDHYSTIAYTTDLTGTWNIKPLVYSTNDETASILDIIYKDGMWIASGTGKDNMTANNYACLAYTTDLTGDWIIKQVWTSVTKVNNVSVPSKLCCMTYANGRLMCGGQYDGYYGCVAELDKSLPLKSESEAYVYIKAKE